MAQSSKRAPEADRATAERDVKAVTHFLALGFPVTVAPGNPHVRSAVRMASDLLGVNRMTFAARIGSPEAGGSHFRRFGLAPDWSIAAARGELGTKPVLPGYEISSTSTQRDADGNTEREWVRQRRARSAEPFVPPEGHGVKGVSALVDGEGRTLAQWIKTDRDKPDPLEIAAALKDAFAEYAGRAEPVPAPADCAADLLTLLPAADWHLGMYAWAAEAGANWDLKLAESVIGAAVDEAVARSPASGHAVVLGGGDLLHADNQDNRTARSGNALQVDGRYQKVLQVACRLMVRAVEASLARHAHVTARILPGNHDEHACVAVTWFLAAWFRNEPRVTIDTDPSLFWYHRHGAVMLAATHGHTVKAADFPSIMAHRRAQEWGTTKYRYAHSFHLHHTAKYATEGNGVVTEVHQSPIPQDAWHFGSGFLSGRSVQTISYHARYGEVSRARVAIIDAEQDFAANG